MIFSCPLHTEVDRFSFFYIKEQIELQSNATRGAPDTDWLDIR
jgi:hypothetical protein